MNKLYKYRPLSEFLFKELYYQELYFASYNELNDPLDLSARIEFTPKDKDAIEYLIWFVSKTQFTIEDFQKSSNNIKDLFNFNKNEIAKQLLTEEIFNTANVFHKEKGKIWVADIIKIIEDSINKQKTNIDIDYNKFRAELERLTKKFLKNSYINCFSETSNNFLMWSHYASKHSGICLEFQLENSSLFPYEKHRKREKNIEKYKKRMSEWDTKTFVFWDRLRKVFYQDEQPFINFYDFAAVFENENDCDLIGLSKSWTHKYAQELEWAFSTKTKSWQYENEWRAIEINFDNTKEPEERIRHYPIESLSAVYFGINTPLDIRNRIFKIFSKKNSNIEFYESILNGTDTINFSLWDYQE